MVFLQYEIMHVFFNILLILIPLWIVPSVILYINIKKDNTGNTDFADKAEKTFFYSIFFIPGISIIVYSVIGIVLIVEHRKKLEKFKN